MLTDFISIIENDETLINMGIFSKLLHKNATTLLKRYKKYVIEM